MVRSVNKWLCFSAVILFSAFSSRHPLHLSTVEINQNEADKTLEISCRIFTDDFETALSKSSGTKANFYDAALKVKMDSLVKKYIYAHLQVKADEKNVSFNYLGFEKEGLVVYVYVEGINISKVKKLVVSNSIMHDMFDDQTNIMHITINGDRKSTKLDYPKTSAVFDF
jgi:hypothetical protein